MVRKSGDTQRAGAPGLDRLGTRLRSGLSFYVIRKKTACSSMSTQPSSTETANPEVEAASSQLHEHCTELVIVCCHAICDDASRATEENSWRMQPFQRSDAKTNKAGEHETFILHILAAISTHVHRPSSLVMFSGGHTTNSPLSEAQSYQQVLENLQPSLFGQTPSKQETALEEYATDSYQNLLFSILRFRKLVGRYPEAVTVITHAFKERRFLELHAAAIKWPRSRLRVQGINPPFTLEELEDTQKGEHERAYKMFADDSYGVLSPLADKRKARNWDPKAAEYLAVEDEVARLLAWTGGESGGEVFPGRLPWEER